jgi:hypothetical protein
MTITQTSRMDTSGWVTGSNLGRTQTLPRAHTKDNSISGRTGVVTQAPIQAHTRGTPGSTVEDVCLVVGGGASHHRLVTCFSLLKSLIACFLDSLHEIFLQISDVWEDYNCLEAKEIETEVKPNWCPEKCQVEWRLQTPLVVPRS